MEGPLHARITLIFRLHLPLSSPAKRHPDSHALRAAANDSQRGIAVGRQPPSTSALVCRHAEGSWWTPERRYQAARLTAALSILGSLKRELGDLDRVTAWLMVYGLVNAVPDFTLTTSMINGFSDLIFYGVEGWYVIG
jgi:hypothetical protein